MRGILYVAIGIEHYNYAVRSLKTVREHMPDTQVAIVTDAHSAAEFDIVIETHQDEYAPEEKIIGIIASPFDETIYLDCDTYLYAHVTELFDALEHFDVVGVMASDRRRWQTVRQVPRIFPEINSGVLAYNKSGVTVDMLDDWLESCINRPSGVNGDMGALREALFYSDVRLCVAPPEFNLYVDERTELGPDVVKVLHGKLSDEKMAIIARDINANKKKRVYEP